jgi:CRP-like cAMP-binding protein
MSTLSCSTTSRTDALEARMQSFAALTNGDVEILRACRDDPKAVPAGSEVLPPRSAEDHPRLIVSGWAAATRILPDGRRQILQIFLPGDVLGVSPLKFDRGAIALTPVTTTDARPLAAALRVHGAMHMGLCLAWERAQAARQQEMLDHIVRLGRLSAYERTGHLLLALIDRHRRAGLSDGQRIPWPLTQETLADVLGLSVVHVNRILQQLRREGLIALRAGQLLVSNAERLTAVAAWEQGAVEIRKLGREIASSDSGSR